MVGCLGFGDIEVAQDPSLDGVDGAMLHVAYALEVAFVVLIAHAIAFRSHTFEGWEEAILIGRAQFFERFTLEMRVERLLLDTVTRGEVDAKDIGYGGSKLLVVERTVLGGLAKLLYTLAKSHEPRILRAHTTGAMTGETIAESAAMIAGEQVGCLAFIERIRLAVFHDFLDESVGGACCLEIEVVLTVVCPLVGIAKRHVEHLRMVTLQACDGIGIGEGIEAL